METYPDHRSLGIQQEGFDLQTFRAYSPDLEQLYNLNDIDDRSAFIVVGNRIGCWKENKLFIFDDTLRHQSFNEADRVRYCLFVDILRSLLSPVLLRLFVKLVHFLFKSANFIFYKK